MKILNHIQQSLKAPKGQRNNFGKYNYRSCEDIVEAIKPLLDGATLTISDDIVEVAARVYVKATATLSLDSESVSVSAFAREALTKKGMDEAQITGAASSYARKYALNGLFAIDDTKDADTNDNSDTDSFADALKCAESVAALGRAWSVIPNDLKSSYINLKDKRKSELAA